MRIVVRVGHRLGHQRVDDQAVVGHDRVGQVGEGQRGLDPLELLDLLGQRADLRDPLGLEHRATVIGEPDERDLGHPEALGDLLKVDDLGVVRRQEREDVVVVFDAREARDQPGAEHHEQRENDPAGADDRVVFGRIGLGGIRLGGHQTAP